MIIVGWSRFVVCFSVFAGGHERGILFEQVRPKVAPESTGPASSGTHVNWLLTTDTNLTTSGKQSINTFIPLPTQALTRYLFLRLFVDLFIEFQLPCPPFRAVSRSLYLHYYYTKFHPTLAMSYSAPPVRASFDGFLFDMDGTIIDSTIAIEKHWHT